MRDWWSQGAEMVRSDAGMMHFHAQICALMRPDARLQSFMLGESGL
jgi:hypothetical protein